LKKIQALLPKLRLKQIVPTHKKQATTTTRQHRKQKPSAKTKSNTPHQQSAASKTQTAAYS
jgi:hypothetical protein